MGRRVYRPAAWTLAGTLLLLLLSSILPFLPFVQPDEMRRITRLLIGAPELRPLGAALLGVWACAGRPALGADGVVLLVGPVGCGPVGRGGHGAQSITHSMKTCAAFALMALP